MPYEPSAALGQFLTASEADALAVQLAAGEHVAHALQWVSAARRDQAGRLLAAAGLRSGRSHSVPQRPAGLLPCTG